jgi:predicted permease
LFALNLWRLKAVDSGVERRGLLVADLDPGEAGFEMKQTVFFNQRLRERVLAIPGVESVSFSQNGIYSGRNYDTMLDAGGKQYTGMAYDHVGPSFFGTVGTRMVAGRDFTAGDDAAAPRVAIVGREFARRVFEGRDAVGQTMYIADGVGKPAYEVIGVVEDVRAAVRSTRPMFYLSQLQTLTQHMSTRLLVRSSRDARAMVPELRAAVRAESAAVHIDRIDTAEALLDSTLDTDRLIGRVAWGFGVLAMTLAAAGVYGLFSYDVMRRRGEIGVRMTVGAGRSDILKMILREAAVLTAVGIAIGSAGALALSRLAQGLVFGVEAGDPRIEAAAAVILGAVALLSAWIPARRAARLDPVAALRTE